MVGGAAEALQSVQIEVFGEIAVDAAIACEEHILGALALATIIVVGLAVVARGASTQLLIPVLRTGTSRALHPVKERSLGRAADADAGVEVIDHVGRAAGALLEVVIEVFGYVAGDASLAIPEGAILAFTDSQSRVVDLARRTSTALLFSDIPEGVLWACHAFVTVKKRAV